VGWKINKIRIFNGLALKTKEKEGFNIKYDELDIDI